MRFHNKLILSTSAVLCISLVCSSRIEAKPPQVKRSVKKPIMSQDTQDKDQLRFLNSCFDSLKRKGKEARVVINGGKNLNLPVGTRDMRVGTTFQMRDRHGSIHYKVQRIDTKFLHIHYRIEGMGTYGLNSGGIGQIALAWK